MHRGDDPTQESLRHFMSDVIDLLVVPALDPRTYLLIGLLGPVSEPTGPKKWFGCIRFVWNV